MFWKMFTKLEQTRLTSREWPCTKVKSKTKIKRKQNGGISDIICYIKQWFSTKG